MLSMEAQLIFKSRESTYQLMYLGIIVMMRDLTLPFKACLEPSMGFSSGKLHSFHLILSRHCT